MIKSKEVEDGSWGYFVDGFIYLHFPEPPDFGLRKYFRKIELLDSTWEIPEGMLDFKIIDIQNTFRHGGAISHSFAEPIFKWERIK